MVSIVVWAVCGLAVSCHGARILAVFPDPARSHMIAYEPLTKALAARGHQVTVISAFPQKEPIANYTDIAVPFSWFGLESYASDLNEWVSFISRKEADTRYFQANMRKCSHYLGDRRVQDLIRSPDSRFDLLIVELQDNECLLGFAHRFDAPVLGVYAQGPAHWSLDVVGAPAPFSHVPSPSLARVVTTDSLTLRQRVDNALSVFARWKSTFFVNMANRLIVAKYFNLSHPVPSVGEMERRTAMLLFNHDLSFGVPRAYLPNTHNIAGMHLKPARSLPAALQRLMDEAGQGVVVFSMGTHLGGTRMSENTARALLDAFTTMKQLVLWKTDRVPSGGGPSENVKYVEWLPLADVIAHRNLVAVMSNGGLLTTQEAIYHGKPMVGIPISGDQFANVARAERLGFAIRLDLKNVSRESVRWALDTVVNDLRYAESARVASRRFRDQIVPPLEKAVFWTEYVIRHKGAGHLRCAALDLAWYQYWLLDVVAVLALAVALPVIVPYAAARWLYSARSLNAREEGKRALCYAYLTKLVGACFPEMP